jgi:hypothetical protein
MSKDKIYLTVIALLAIALIAGCALQSQQVKRLTVSEIIVPKEGLIFKTDDGKLILKIRTTENGGSLAIYNNQGEPVAGINARENGGMLGIFNNQKKLVAWMGALRDCGFLSVLDNQGNTIWSKP